MGGKLILVKVGLSRRVLEGVAGVGNELATVVHRDDDEGAGEKGRAKEGKMWVLLLISV